MKRTKKVCKKVALHHEQIEALFDWTDKLDAKANDVFERTGAIERRLAALETRVTKDSDTLEERFQALRERIARAESSNDNAKEVALTDARTAYYDLSEQAKKFQIALMSLSERVDERLKLLEVTKFDKPHTRVCAGCREATSSQYSVNTGYCSASCQELLHANRGDHPDHPRKDGNG